MELTMAAQDDASPWEVPPPPAAAPAIQPAAPGPLPGRAYFSRLGIVRRKPSRADAPSTASKSCSDKLALKQCTSLLSSLTALFVGPLPYLESLVLPASQYSAAACRRAFSPDGRMVDLAAAAWPGSRYAFRPFVVETTDHVFHLSREAVRARARDRNAVSPCNIAASWLADGLQESIIGGVLQGKKPFHQGGASRMSRRHMWSAAAGLADLLDKEHYEIKDQLNRQTYGDVKDGPLLADRRAVKAEVRQEALAGWSASGQDSAFGRDVAD